MTTSHSSLLIVTRAMLIACALWCCIGCISGTAAEEQPAGQKPYPLDNCVVSNDKIDLQVPPVIYKGQEFRFCCRGCVKKFNREPDKYAARLAASTNRLPPVTK